MPAGVTLLMSACPADPMAEGKRGPLSPLAENSEPEKSQDCKPVQLEKTNHLDFEVAAGRGGRDVVYAELAMSRELSKPRLGRPLARRAHTEQRQSIFTELPCLQERMEDIQAQKRELEGSAGQLGPQQLISSVPRDPAGGIVCSVWPGAARGEQRSAFSKPAKCPAETLGCFPMLMMGGSAENPQELSGSPTTVDSPCWARLSTVKLVGDFWNLHMLSQNILLCNAFQRAPTQWLEHTQVQVPTPSVPSARASRAFLPPTLSSLGLSTQNWCAKCSLAFRLTADLVFHMRSHHKREHMSPDPHSKKRRGAALICPVCHECFRERHHLSRHMTSHS
ncbi:zinc finger protein 488 [Nannospalax galili]|uniref:Zinc finger protein 488 n=1 Tax=Nannospalax galili TaxID=1026970 RepID=A0A8C6RMU1_NANGA|nr:zinc finger protein 488 [Nannospalax galili]